MIIAGPHSFGPRIESAKFQITKNSNFLESNPGVTNILDPWSVGRSVGFILSDLSMPMNPAIQFRIHREFSDVSGVVVSLFEKCEKGFVFQHPEDEEVARTHVHGFLFSPTITRKTLSEYIAKKLFLKGNTDFYTSDKCGKKDKRPLDLSGAYCYGSKWDTIAPSFIKEISQTELAELKIYAQSKATIGNIARNTHTTEIVVIKEVKVKTKPSLYQHVVTVVNRINDQFPDLVRVRSHEAQRKIIFEVCFNYFRECELFIGKYRQLDFMDMVLLKFNCVEYKNQLFGDFQRRTTQYS